MKRIRKKIDQEVVTRMNHPNLTVQPDTPSLIVDAARMQRNIDKMGALAVQAGVKLRPHAKTHKMPGVAKLQLDAGASGITVAKLSEAEIMADHGIDDLFIALPFVSEAKLERAMRLAERASLIVGVDSLAGAERLAAAAASAGRTMDVRLEIDTGMRRTGVLYDDALKLAHDIAGLQGLRLTGIYTYRGALLRGGVPTLDLAQAGEEEGRLMAALADRMRASGIPIRDVSVGSTPTAAYAARVPGVTEIRPGTYVFQDRMQARFGVCEPEDWAVSVRVTVVSRPAPDLAVIDGGSKTFATDVQPNGEPLRLAGYGHVLELEDALFERLSEEHGMLRLGPAAQAAGVQIGDTLHIVPNHVCSTVNLHNQAVFVHADGSRTIVPVLARGKLE